MEHQTLRDDEEVQHLIIDIACNRNAKRGRRNFILFLGDPSCRQHAKAIAAHLDDDFVCEYVIKALIDMKVDGFIEQVRFLMLHEDTRVRRQAELYCDQFTEKNR